MKNSKPIVYIQIGTNSGNDEFNLLVRKNNPSKIILVEPNAVHNDSIRSHYRGIDVIIENVAIVSSESQQSFKLVHPKNSYNGKAANGLRYEDTHFSLVPMDDWGDDLTTIESIGLTFNQLCQKHNVDRVSYLQIDTEGYDSEIIKSIDFTKITIDKIKYEYWPFLEKCFTRHGDKSGIYGKNGMRLVEDILKAQGYSLYFDKRDIVATSNILTTQKR